MEALSGLFGRRVLWLAASVLLGTLSFQPASAQDLSDEATERAVRAAVRIQVDVPGGSSTGSGTIIDRRGYVLTNFHVVGQVRHGERGGMPGAFLGDGQHVQIATVESDRDTARTRWIGRVVRADVRLDLALIRIVARADGSPIPAGTTFPTVELGSTRDLRPGASLWCFGFPMGVRTINVTGGHMTGYQMNTRGEVAWVRSDAEFNPGNSGGMLVDRRGRLIAVPTAVLSGDETLEPIEVARPVERMPQDWTRALERGHIDDVAVGGVLALAAGIETSDEATGDGGAMDAPDVYYYQLPAERPATITIQPALPMGLIGPNGRPLREGEGQLSVWPSDPPGSVVAVLIPRAGDGATVQLRLRYEAQGSAYAVAGQGGLGTRGAAPGPGAQQPYAYGGLQTIPPSSGGPGYIGPTYGGPGYGAPGGPVAVRGRLIDASTGTPVQGMVLVGQPGVDLGRHIAIFLAGQISEAQFQSRLIASVRTDSNGFYQLPGVPRGSFPGAGVGAGYRPAMITLNVRMTDPPIVDVNPIQLGR